MAEQGGAGSVPDLQSILANLAQYSAPTHAAPLQAASGPAANDAEHDLQSRGPAASLPPQSQQGPGRPQDPRLRRPRTHSAAPAPKPMIDPATITVWPDALRCVTKMAAQNPRFAECVKRMIKDQRQNEMRWYSERQNLKSVQANRAAEAAKAESILKSLNAAAFETLPDLETPEQKKERELLEFDRKIYAAQESMNAAMTAELKSLGVPFFGTNESLIVPDDQDLSEVKLPDDHPKYSTVVSRSQFQVLQAKMTQHLEDMYRE